MIVFLCVCVVPSFVSCKMNDWNDRKNKGTEKCLSVCHAELANAARKSIFLSFLFFCHRLYFSVAGFLLIHIRYPKSHIRNLSSLGWASRLNAQLISHADTVCPQGA